MIELDAAIIVDIPKCGCNSILAATGAKPSKPMHSREIPPSDKPRVTVVRNPYSRALSLFHYKRQRVLGGGVPQAFWDEWNLAELSGFLMRLIWNREHPEQPWPRHYPMFLPCALWLAPCEPIDHVLRLETLQDDWDALGFLPRVTIPHVNRGTYAHLLTVAEQRLIERWAYEDFERYGYRTAG